MCDQAFFNGLEYRVQRAVQQIKLDDDDEERVPQASHAIGVGSKDVVCPAVDTNTVFVYLLTKPLLH